MGGVELAFLLFFLLPFLLLVLFLLLSFLIFILILVTVGEVLWIHLGAGKDIPGDKIKAR